MGVLRFYHLLGTIFLKASTMNRGIEPKEAPLNAKCP